MSIGFAPALRPGRLPSVVGSGQFPAGGGSSPDPGLTLLQSATLWLDASDVTNGSQWIRNKGTGGRALDARLGSVGSAQIVKGALKLPGTTGNNASATTSTTMGGSVDVMALVAPRAWRGLSVNAWGVELIYGSTAAGRQWKLGISATASNFLVFTVPGLADYNSTAAPPFADGDFGWIRATFDSATGNLKFYTATFDGTSNLPSSWTQLGTTVAGSAGAFASNNSISIWSSPGLVSGSARRVRVLNGYDGAGTVQFDADFTAQSDLATSFTESSSNAATVTINSTSGVDTNDPLLLTHTGTNYLYLPGVAGNNATIPDAAAIDPLTQFEMIARVRATYSGTVIIASKRSGTPDGWQWYMNGGQVKFFSASAATPDVGVTHALTNGVWYWLRVTGNSTDRQFFFAADQASVPSSWTQIGTAQAAINVATGDNTGVLSIGGDSNSGFAELSIARFILRTTIGGANQVDADFTATSNQSSFTESSSNAATVTINRATSGRKSAMVVRPTLLFGTDDYLEVADNDLLDIGPTDSLSALIVMRQWPTSGSFGARISKTAGATGAGWALLNDTTTANNASSLADGTVQVYNTANKVAYTHGNRFIATLVRSVPADNLTTWTNTTAGTPLTDTTAASPTNSLPLRVGNQSVGSFYADMEVDHVAVFKGTVLDATTIGQIMSYLGVS